jgi:hypothetical protein
MIHVGVKEKKFHLCIRMKAVNTYSLLLLNGYLLANDRGNCIV